MFGARFEGQGVEDSFYVSFFKKEVRPGALQNGLQSTILLLSGCAQTLSPSPREDAAKWTYPLFLSQKELFSSFWLSAMQQNFLLCNKASCYAVKLSAVYWSCPLCIKAFYHAVKLFAIKPSAVQWSYLLCIKAVCYALRLSAVLYSFLP